VAEADCGEITVENRIKLASQLEINYPQESFIFSLMMELFWGLFYNYGFVI